MSHAVWPVDPAMIAPFLVAVILIEVTPGPNMAYLAALAAAHGRRAGLMAVAGVTCGLSVYMLAAVFGLTEVFRLYRPLYERGLSAVDGLGRLAVGQRKRSR